MYRADSMMERKVKILPGFYIFVAVALLLAPIKWLAAWMLAAAIHELSHIFMLKLLRCQVLSVRVGASGAVIEAGCDARWKQLLCTLAGPLSGFALLIFLRVMPRVALCGMIQSLYNLLPFSSLDGGKILEIIAQMLFPRSVSKRIVEIIQFAGIGSLLLLALYGTFFLKLGLIPTFLVGILIIKKSLANKGHNEYNRFYRKVRGYCYGRTYQKNFADGSKACQIYRR